MDIRPDEPCRRYDRRSDQPEMADRGQSLRLVVRYTDDGIFDRFQPDLYSPRHYGSQRSFVHPCRTFADHGLSPRKNEVISRRDPQTGLYTGQALGGFGATIAGAYSWETTFHWFGIIGIAYSLILILFLKEKKDHTVAKLDSEPGPKENPVKAAIKGMGMLFVNISFWIILLYFATSSLPGWATKNWLPTLFSENLSIDMSEAGPLSTFTIAISSFIGVIAGGILSDKWIQRNVRGRIYTGSIGLALTIPALLLLGFGDSFAMIVGGGLCFGIGFGIFDANNMPILCQFVSPRYRATAYGIMNMTGVFAGAIITKLLGESTDAGNLGQDFAMMAGLVFVALMVEVIFLRPKTVNMTDK